MARGSKKTGHLLGAVLAGGSSRRMGRDKALLEIDGRSFVERAVTVLESHCDEVVIIAPSRPAYRSLAVEVVPDLRPGLGPLAGIHAALVHGAGRPVFVLACDLPHVSRELIGWMTDSPDPSGHAPVDPAWGRRPVARVVRDGSGVQPLCALYSHECLAAVEEALDRGRLSARELVERLDTEYLDLDPSAEWYRPEMLTNVNTARDLVAAAWTAEPSS